MRVIKGDTRSLDNTLSDNLTFRTRYETGHVGES